MLLCASYLRLSAAPRLRHLDPARSVRRLPRGVVARAVHAKARHVPARRLRLLDPARRSDRRADRGGGRPAARHGACDRVGHHAGSRPVHRGDRGLSDLGAGWQPAADRRADRSVRRGRVRDHRAPRLRRPAAGHAARGRDADPARPRAPRHDHQVYPLSRGDRLHLGHRGDHLHEPDQGIPRPRAGQRAGRLRRQDRGDRWGAADP